jgi:hypothetical protein
MAEKIATYADILALARPQDRILCDGIRLLVYAIHPKPVELAWPKQKVFSFGIGPKKMSQHYVYIGVQASYVNLGFYKGTALKDPQGLLEGTGKELRHIKIRALNDLENPHLKALVVQSYVSIQQQSQASV